MKKTLHVVICLVTLLCGTALAQNPSTRAEDEKTIRAICKGSVVPKNEEFPKEHEVLPVMIFTKEKGRWQVAVFQNLRLPPEAEK